MEYISVRELEFHRANSSNQTPDHAILPLYLISVLSSYCHAQLQLQLSKTEKEFHVVEEMYAASRMRMCA